MTRFYIVVSTNEEMKTEATRLLHKTASESKILKWRETGAVPC